MSCRALASYSDRQQPPQQQQQQRQQQQEQEQQLANWQHNYSCELIASKVGNTILTTSGL